MATVMSGRGVRLTRAGLQPCSEDGRHSLVGIEHPHRLLEHYFGKGDPSVIVLDDSGHHTGRLDTRWDGTGRRWWLTFETRLEAVAPEPAAPKVLAAV